MRVGEREAVEGVAVLALSCVEVKREVEEVIVDGTRKLVQGGDYTSDVVPGCSHNKTIPAKCQKEKSYYTLFGRFTSLIMTNL